MYALLDKNKKVIKYPYSIQDFKKDYYNTSFPNNITEEELKKYSVYKVIEKTAPYINNFYYTVQEDTPIYNSKNEVLYQQWIINKLSIEEIKNILPTITMRQLRLILFNKELLETVSKTIESPKLQIEWEYATEISINSELIKEIQNSIGIDDETLIKLFIEALEL